MPTSDPREMFLAHIGFAFRHDGEGFGVGQAPVDPEICLDGLVRPSVLLTFSDIVAGSLANVASLPRVCMTIDLDIQIFSHQPVDSLRLEGRVLKSGRTTTITETRITAPGVEGLVALSLGSFMASPRPQDLMPEIPTSGPRVRTTTLRAPLAEAVGIRRLEEGVAEVDRTEYVLNPAGTLQGGIVALVAEEAARSLAGAGGRLIEVLDVRYLTAVRVGPARAVATAIAADHVRVEVRDRGAGDRLSALVIVRFSALG